VKARSENQIDFIELQKLQFWEGQLRMVFSAILAFILWLIAFWVAGELKKDSTHPDLFAAIRILALIGSCLINLFIGVWTFPSGPLVAFASVYMVIVGGERYRIGDLIADSESGDSNTQLRGIPESDFVRKSATALPQSALIDESTGRFAMAGGTPSDRIIKACYVTMVISVLCPPLGFTALITALYANRTLPAGEGHRGRTVVNFTMIVGLLTSLGSLAFYVTTY
jgi:hypothetical protein